MFGRNLRYYRGVDLYRALWLSTLLALAGCLGGGKSSDGPKPPASACDELRTRVQGLYEAHLPAAEGEAALLRRQEQISDDTEMVLTDCRADPARVLPCLKASVSAPQLERDCLIPLDDRGTVEGKAFAGSG